MTTPERLQSMQAIKARIVLLFLRHFEDCSDSKRSRAQSILGEFMTEPNLEQKLYAAARDDPSARLTQEKWIKGEVFLPLRLANALVRVGVSQLEHWDGDDDEDDEDEDEDDDDDEDDEEDWMDEHVYLRLDNDDW